jgi:hypothetical protein
MSHAAKQSNGSELPIAGVLPAAALDERLAIVGTSGSGKTYAAKGLVEQLLEASARVYVVDPLGMWWGLRAGADGATPGYPVVVFGGRHADVALDESMGAALGRLVGTRPLACVVDLSELGSAAARRRFMAAFAEALYETNREPLHLVLDEADLWAPQRPLPEANALLGRIEEIMRRGRVRGFIPWLITQRPAIIHKDVLSQADILIAMKLTSSQDRDAVGGWIEGQADRAEGRRILADLPKLSRGEGYLWAPSDDVLARVVFPHIRTYDSSRTPKRGERISTPRTLAEVDLSAITAALAEPRLPGPDRDVAASGSRRRLTELEHQLTERDRLLTAARARIVALEAEATALRSRLGHIASLAAEAASLASPMAQHGGAPTAAAVIACAWVQGAGLPPGCPSRCRTTTSGGGRDRCIAPGGTQAAHGLCSARAGPLHLGTGGNPGGPEAKRRALQCGAQATARYGSRRRGHGPRDRQPSGNGGRRRGAAGAVQCQGAVGPLVFAPA